MAVSNKKFFEDVSSRANHVDIQSVKVIYYAIIKTILKDVEKKEVIYLPNFGKFYLASVKARYAPSFNHGPKVFWPAIKIIKFTACVALKEYFKKKF